MIDASVAVRCFVDAPAFPAGQALLRSGESLVAPELIIAEAANAAWKMARDGRIGADQAAAIVKLLPSLFARLVPISGLADAAFAAARELDHPVYDCFYLVLAEREDARLATADARLIARVKATRWAKRIKPLPLPPARGRRASRLLSARTRGPAPSDIE
ncbi:MAG: type II toxin-antitoxin system VapC family toxin [Pseudomonadota bacterium]